LHVKATPANAGTDHRRQEAHIKRRIEKKAIRHPELGEITRFEVVEIIAGKKHRSHDVRDEGLD